jgi:hypothetical protein
MARKRKTQKVLLGGVLEFSKAYPALTDAVLTYEEFDFRGLVRDGVPASVVMDMLWGAATHFVTKAAMTCDQRSKS